MMKPTLRLVAVKVHGPEPTSLFKPQNTVWSGPSALVPSRSFTHPAGPVKLGALLLVTNATHSRLPMARLAGAAIDIEFANATLAAPLFTTAGAEQSVGVAVGVAVLVAVAVEVGVPPVAVAVAVAVAISVAVAVALAV